MKALYSIPCHSYLPGIMAEKKTVALRHDTRACAAGLPVPSCETADPMDYSLLLKGRRDATYVRTLS